MSDVSSSPAPAPSPPTGAVPTLRRHRTWAERIILLLGALSSAVAAGGAGALAWGLDKWEQIETVDLGVAGPAAEGEASNWLLIGSDSRSGIDADHRYAGYILGDGVPEGKRTDTIMIARVEPSGQFVHLLSIPRDLWVTYPDGTKGRINGAFAGDNGEQRLLDTVEQNLNIEVNHYAEVNFAGFEDIVDAIGGVPIWFDRPMRDLGSGLNITSAGCHVLDGADALAFARGRTTEYFDDGQWRVDGTGDLGRNSRQQYFLRRVAATAVQRLDIGQLGTINGLLNAGGQNFVKDQTVSPDDLVDLARIFRNVGEEQIVTHVLPVYDFRTSEGAAVLGLQEAEAGSVLAVFRGEEAVPEVAAAEPEATTYQVLNGSRVAGQATAVSDGLASRGFSMAVADNFDPTEQTTVRYGPGQEAAAAEVAAQLTADPVYVLISDLSMVQLVTGADFTGLADTPREGVAGPTPPPEEEAPAPESDPVIGVVPAPTPAGTECE